MLIAKRAVFSIFDTVRMRALILGRVLVATLTLFARQYYYIPRHRLFSLFYLSFNHFTDNAGADGLAALTDGKSKLFLYGNRHY